MHIEEIHISNIYSLVEAFNSHSTPDTVRSLVKRRIKIPLCPTICSHERGSRRTFPNDSDRLLLAIENNLQRPQRYEENYCDDQGDKSHPSRSLNLVTHPHCEISVSGHKHTDHDIRVQYCPRKLHNLLFPFFFLWLSVKKLLEISSLQNHHHTDADLDKGGKYCCHVQGQICSSSVQLGALTCARSKPPTPRKSP